MIPLLRRVVAQTTQRVFEGDTHVPDKVVSLFEPHTTPIRKGKIVTPTEFGQLVSIQEADGQIVTAYAVHDGRPADSTLWEPALDAHEQHLREAAGPGGRGSRVCLGGQRSRGHGARRAAGRVAPSRAEDAGPARA